MHEMKKIILCLLTYIFLPSLRIKIIFPYPTIQMDKVEAIYSKNSLMKLMMCTRKTSLRIVVLNFTSALTQWLCRDFVYIHLLHSIVAGHPTTVVWSMFWTYFKHACVVCILTHCWFSQNWGSMSPFCSVIVNFLCKCTSETSNTTAVT
jgi:hypothetical protein